ncbi:hypothetical protein PoMZ_09267 [Pyricularia oryzae]|uniref:Uncharacterized protein n=1 Tax=Pyricularia oryzae TaxID=318829 RepID=A0A4P7MTR3_PYROR|nr:hypothetical protein PoMZ_09267 [Pyricularia oryzae]
MRGGEPMARGVYQTFFLAMFAFAKYPYKFATKNVAGAIEFEVDGIFKGGSFRRKLGWYGNVGIMALRVSENKYIGAKGINIGNRLFNTTHWH